MANELIINNGLIVNGKAIGLPATASNEFVVLSQLSSQTVSTSSFTLFTNIESGSNFSGSLPVSGGELLEGILLISNVNTLQTRIGLTVTGSEINLIDLTSGSYEFINFYKYSNSNFNIYYSNITTGSIITKLIKKQV